MDKHINHPIIVFLIAALFFAVIFVFGRDTTDEPINRTSTDTQTVTEELPVQEEESAVTEPKVTEVETVEPVILECTDCWLAPVDKDHSLPSTYTPDVEATGLSGGGSLTPKAAQALRDLFSAATADGLSMYVRSAYRSYQTQVATFEKWVGVEMANGLSRTEAEAKANTYSARPGQSEHQLGTTTDLLCSGQDFDNSPCNEEVWQWLADNADSFGFALSYPEGKDDNTGYTSEPWHYRYIGVNNTTAFKAQTAQTLNQWLLAKWQ